MEIERSLILVEFVLYDSQVVATVPAASFGGSFTSFFSSFCGSLASTASAFTSTGLVSTGTATGIASSATGFASIFITSSFLGASGAGADTSTNSPSLASPPSFFS